ncbi:L-threonine dehydratase catabolic TdcB-like [Gigantopelta aegis]|uniref:L-threonine dehydratase catabolic TdcB-like n=1 Tax=Gigantopelta aegis TaxID=1735272 RepID=UPI001B88E36B|nr:L-threonine dehydratase catabolic TdcB-like [Gigantopelta aegis]XP_041377982.1 L-threonine dehydratase catabolic TdcB-like [Gigantopelta aegis]
MAAEEDQLVTLDDVFEAQQVLADDSLTLRTPVLKHVQTFFTSVHQQNIDLYLKLENMQTMGSFKIRGVTNQMKKLVPKIASGQKLITISAGNYGKSFAFALKSRGIPGICIMPDSVPFSRVQLIRDLGVEVEQVPTIQLQSTVDRYVTEQGYLYCHPFNSTPCVAAYGSIALEILEDVPNPDIVLVPCGGGALTAGVAAAIKLSGQSQCRVYGVEPEQAASMFESFKAGHAVTLPTTKSVAAGLSPPYAGTITYNHCKHFTEGILLVTDEEIVKTVDALYRRGLVVEPSGAAAMAAMIYGKIPDVQNKKVVVLISGGNITPEEMNQLLPDFTKPK